MTRRGFALFVLPVRKTKEHNRMSSNRTNSPPASPDDNLALAGHAAAIHHLGRQAVKNVIEIGRRSACGLASKNCKPKFASVTSRSPGSKARSRKRRLPPRPRQRASRRPGARFVTRKNALCCGPFLSVTTASTSTRSAKPHRPLMTGSTFPHAWIAATLHHQQKETER